MKIYLSTGHYTNSEIMETPWRIHIAVMTIALVFGLSSNAVVIAVRLCSKTKRDRNAYKFFILQLAIADLIFASTIPFDLYDHINHNEWAFGKWGCKFIRTIQSISITAEIGFLAGMTVERYIGIVKPFSRVHWSSRKLIILVLVNWLWFAITFIPLFLALDVDGHCGEMNHPSQGFRKGYTLFLFISDYVCPLLLILGINIKIVHSTVVHQESFRMHQEEDSQNIMQSRQKLVEENAIHVKRESCQSQINERKLFKILGVITLCFALFTLPNQIFYLWLDFGNPEDWSETHGWVMIMFGGLLYLHCVVNPLLYSIMDRQFRVEAAALIKRMVCFRPRRGSGAVSSGRRIDMKPISPPPTNPTYVLM